MWKVKSIKPEDLEAGMLLARIATYYYDDREFIYRPIEDIFPNWMDNYVIAHIGEILRDPKCGAFCSILAQCPNEINGACNCLKIWSVEYRDAMSLEIDVTTYDLEDYAHVLINESDTSKETAHDAR